MRMVLFYVCYGFLALVESSACHSFHSMQNNDIGFCCRVLKFMESNPKPDVNFSTNSIVACKMNWLMSWKQYEKYWQKASISNSETNNTTFAIDICLETNSIETVRCIQFNRISWNVDVWLSFDGYSFIVNCFFVKYQTMLCKHVRCFHMKFDESKNNETRTKRFKIVKNSHKMEIVSKLQSLNRIELKRFAKTSPQRIQCCQKQPKKSIQCNLKRNHSIRFIVWMK